jgi:hypothetical protein
MPRRSESRTSEAPNPAACCVQIALWGFLGTVPVMALANPSDLCLLAARDAAQINAVPVSVMIAITQTETGRMQDGQTRPWPWTVNVEGEGHWFPDRSTATAFAQEQFDRGARSFDVGCFQINFRWHGENFVSLDQMFDPMANATYAAHFLISLKEENGDWSSAAGAFHSRTEVHAERYRDRFDAFREAAVAAGVDEGAGAFQLALAEEENLTLINDAAPTGRFPLLSPSDAPRTPGSLVPLLSGG